MAAPTAVKRRGHPVLGALSGLLFGLCASLALLSFGAVALSSILLLIVPVAFLVLGLAWGLLAPLGR